MKALWEYLKQGLSVRFRQTIKKLQLKSMISLYFEGMLFKYNAILLIDLSRPALSPTSNDCVPSPIIVACSEVGIANMLTK